MVLPRGAISGSVSWSDGRWHGAKWVWLANLATSHEFVHCEGDVYERCCFKLSARYKQCGILVRDKLYVVMHMMMFNYRFVSNYIRIESKVEYYCFENLCHFI
jgi:hypothetical protein